MNLYRYITLDRFFSSLRSKNGEWYFTVRFNSPINFEDKWEGLGNGLTKQLNSIVLENNYINRALSDGGTVEGEECLHKSLNSIYNIKDSLNKELLEAIEYSNMHLMSCWFVGDGNNRDSESFAMWELYAKNNGILIGYTIQEILDALGKTELKIKDDKVSYKDFLAEEFDTNKHCSLESLFFKDKSYEHEKEYRFIINEKSTVSFKDAELPLPSVLIANPSFSEETILKLNSAISKYGNLTLKKSNLSTKFSRNEILDYLK